MGRRSLAPISRLGIEALTARIVRRRASRKQAQLFFAGRPDAGIPARRRPEPSPSCGSRTSGRWTSGQPGRRERTSRICSRCTSRNSTDGRSRICRSCSALAADEARQGTHRFLDLPLVLLDPTVDSPRHGELLARGSRSLSAVLAAAISGENPALAALEALLEIPGRRSGCETRFDARPRPHLAVFSGTTALGASRSRSAVFRAGRKPRVRGNRAPHSRRRTTRHAASTASRSCCAMSSSISRWSRKPCGALRSRATSAAARAPGAFRPRVPGVARLRRRRLFGFALRRIFVARTIAAVGRDRRAAKTRTAVGPARRRSACELLCSAARL